MKLQKVIFLFLALLFPICIFLFLKIFGKNEFTVEPLYSNVYPEEREECGIEITLPYHIPDSVQAELNLVKDSLTLVHFGEVGTDSQKQLNRIANAHESNVRVQVLTLSAKFMQWKKCIFFLKDPYNLALVDKEGVILGQYISSDREEIDRLLTELTILFKNY